MRQNGAITVFLAMSFILVLSVVFAVLESARLQAARMLIETSMDASMESVMAGYQKELYDKYDILVFDGSDGSGSISEDKVCAQINTNMDHMLNPVRGTALNNTDFYKVSCGNIELVQTALATDDGGLVFRDCAIQFVREFLGERGIQSLSGKYEWAVQNVQESSAYTDKEAEVGAAISGCEEEKARIDAEKGEEAQLAEEQMNPAVQADNIRSMGILELVCEDTSEISRKGVTLSGLPSQRELYRGNVSREHESGMLSNILFQNYLMRKFPHAVSGGIDTEGNLSYQLEYLLIGEQYDADNLKGVINRLLLIREGANFTYLLTDAVKVAEAYGAAMALVGYTCLPPLIEATKYALLLAWAYAESVLDVRVLLAGEKCAAVKTAQTWKTSIANIGEVASMDPRQMSDKDGLTYADYLQMMLFVSDQSQLAMRALDLMELQVQYLTDNRKFRIDCCVAEMKAKAALDTESVFLTFPFMRQYINGESGSMEITRCYSYDMW